MAYALAALSGLLYAAIFPPLALAPLSWIALVPLLRALDGAGGRRAAGLLACFGFVTTVTITAWLVPTAHEYFDRPIGVTLLLSATVGASCIAPYFALCFALLGAIQRDLPRWLWLLLIPLAWTAAEYSRTQLGLRSSWGLLGVAHVDSERLRQIADVTAIYGVSAIVALGNVVCAEALRLVALALGRRDEASGAAVGRGVGGRSRGEGDALVVALVFCALLGASLGYGEWRRRAYATEEIFEPLEVSVVQGSFDQDRRWMRGEAKRLLMHYGDLSERALRAADPPPDLIVWPESALQTSAHDPIYGPPLQRIVDRLGVPVVLGAPRRTEAGTYNSAFFLRPQSAPLHYDKIRLLPFSEVQPIDALAAMPARGDAHVRSYLAGSEPGLFEGEGHRYGVLICFEAIYPGMARRVVARGADVILNLTNDGWYRGRGGARQHLDHVVFRAIETGVPLIRATTTGITALISPAGEIVERLPADESAVLTARVPAARAGGTPYMRIGDLYARLASGVLLVVGSVVGVARVRAPALAEDGLPE